MERNITNNIESLPQIVNYRSYSAVEILCCLTLLLVVFFVPMPDSVSAEESASKVKTIAITEIVEHPALEEAKYGILSALTEAGYIKGKNLKIIQQNAQGGIANAALIAQNFVHAKVDAIVAISTPSAQSAIKATKNTQIPVVFAAVTDPVAAGLIANLSVAEHGITGAMDYPPTEELISLIRKIMPNIKTIGVLYNSGEANSVKTVALFKAAVGDQWQVIESIATNSSQISQAVYKLIGKVDAIYLPSDNTAFASMPNIVQLTRKHKMPVFANEPTAVKQGCLASIGYSQHEVGRTAGKLLVKVLNGETSLKAETPAQTEIFMNKKSANLMKIAIPDDVGGKIVKVVE